MAARAGARRALLLLTSNRANPAIRLAQAVPQRMRVAVKHSLAGVEERDVYPAVYRANTVEQLDRMLGRAGFTADHVTVRRNRITGSLFTGITTGGYCNGADDCGCVRTGFVARQRLSPA